MKAWLRDDTDPTRNLAKAVAAYRTNPTTANTIALHAAAHAWNHRHDDEADQ